MCRRKFWRSVSLCRGPTRNLGIPHTRNFESRKASPRKGTSLSAVGMLGENRGGHLSWGSGKVCEDPGMKIIHRRGTAGGFRRVIIYRGLEKPLEMGTFLHSGSVKNQGCSIHWELWDNWRRVPWTEHLAVWALCERSQEGGSITRDPDVYVEGSGDGHLFA